MRVMACLVAGVLALAPAAEAQTIASPFVGHWVGNEDCSYGKGEIVLDISATDSGVEATMRAAGIGTLHDATFSGDTITMTWTNFMSHVTFSGKFVSLDRVEGTYHESITGEDCTWFAVNQTPQAGALMPQGASAPPAAASAPQVALPAPATSSPSTPATPNLLDVWKQHADADKQKLAAQLAPDAKDRAVKQFCEFSPDQGACAARIGQAFDFLTTSSFATLAIASKNKAASLPPMQPAAGLPSLYDVYQIYMFLTHDPSP
jgi:hypothetical protein